MKGGHAAGLMLRSLRRHARGSLAAIGVLGIALAAGVLAALQYVGLPSAVTVPAALALGVLVFLGGVWTAHRYGSAESDPAGDEPQGPPQESSSSAKAVTLEVETTTRETKEVVRACQLIIDVVPCVGDR